MLVNYNDIDWHDYLSKFGLEEETKHKRRKQNKHRIMNVYSAFDIETSTIWCDPDKKKYDVHSFMYHWQMQIEDYTVIGRYWEEWFSFLDVLREALEQIKEDNKLSLIPYMVCWVHNLSYEWTFLQSLYNFTNDEIFFRDERKPIYCRMYDTFEFRCSYIQSNMSLSALCENTGVKQKLSGQKFDYDKVRFPWTQLTDFEKEYCITDVESLVKAMKIRVQREGDNLQSVPLTSTGYVRRDCKAALKNYYLDLREMKPGDKETFSLLRDCFRGGNTHANKLYVDQIIDNVTSYDIASSYPTQQLTKKFPMKKFSWLKLDQRTSKARIERIFMFIGLGYAVVGRYQFKNIRLKDFNEPIPYISFSRCDAKCSDDRVLKIDNGRVMQAGYMEIACTEIDLKIILKQYDYDEFDCMKCMIAYKDYLPEEYRNVILSYYKRKTLLKGDDSPEGQYMYTKSKNLLNAIFGMSCQNPVHNDIVYDPFHKLEQEHETEYYTRCYDDFTKEELEKLLKDAAFPYQWGVYCTAEARAQLQLAIDLTKRKDSEGNLVSNLLYCDTDSVKVIGDLDITGLNKKLKARAEETGSYADDKNGKRHYIGLFDFDGHYDKFITQGSKRYAYETNGKIGITVAGVSKKINEETGKTFAVEELGSLKKFRVGMKWEKAGGTTAVYNTYDNFDYTDPETGNKIHIGSNVALVPSTYIMSYSHDYKLLLKEIMLYGAFKRKHE